MALFHLSVFITHPFDDPGPNYKLTFSLLFLSHPANGTETAKGLGVICVMSGIKGSPFKAQNNFLDMGEHSFKATLPNLGASPVTQQ